MNLNNFRDMQRITNTEFFDNYGNSSIEEIQATNKALKNSITKKSFDGIEQLRAEEQAEYDSMSNPNDEIKRKEIYDKYDKLITPLIRRNKNNSLIAVGSIAIASAGAYLIINHLFNGSKRS
jgi:anaerobic ribonucleoside-triphosphate reductase